MLSNQNAEVNISQIFVAAKEFQLISKRNRSSDAENLWQPVIEERERKMIQLSSNARLKITFAMFLL